MCGSASVAWLGVSYKVDLPWRYFLKVSTSQRTHTSDCLLFVDKTTQQELSCFVHPEIKLVT